MSNVIHHHVHRFSSAPQTSSSNQFTKYHKNSYFSNDERQRQREGDARERRLDARLDLAVADDETALLVARDEHDALVRARVELVEAREHVRHVHDRPPDLVDLVEDVVPEELDDVPVAGLGPPRLVVVSMERLSVRGVESSM